MVSTISKVTFSHELLYTTDIYRWFDGLASETMCETLTNNSRVL